MIRNCPTATRNLKPPRTNNPHQKFTLQSEPAPLYMGKRRPSKKETGEIGIKSAEGNKKPGIIGGNKPEGGDSTNSDTC